MNNYYYLLIIATYLRKDASLCLGRLFLELNLVILHSHAWENTPNRISVDCAITP